MEPSAGITEKGSELDARISPLISDKHDPETLEIDEVAERRLIRKLDLYIVPMVMLLYLLVWKLPCAFVCPTNVFRHSPFLTVSTSVTRVSTA